VNRVSKIRKRTTCASLRLLFILTALVSLGVSSLVPEALPGGHTVALALADHAPEDGREAVVIERHRASEQECAPTNTCLPKLLHPGAMPVVPDPGSGHDIGLPQLAVDLWHALPTAPVPIV
jgi:hypothetical protein